MAKSLRSMALCRVIQYRAHRRHLRVFEHRVPARLFVLEPPADALAMVLSHYLVDAIDEVAQPLAQCHPAQALALATPVEQGVELRAPPLAYQGRDADQFARELVESVAQAKAQACPWKQGPHAADGTVKAIGQDTSHLVRGLMCQGRTLKHAVGLGERRRALGVAIPQVPDNTALDDAGQVDPLGEATAVFLIRQDIRGQR